MFVAQPQGQRPVTERKSYSAARSTNCGPARRPVGSEVVDQDRRPGAVRLEARTPVGLHLQQLQQPGLLTAGGEDAAVRPSESPSSNPAAEIGSRFIAAVDELLAQLDHVVVRDQRVRQADECGRQTFIAVHRNSFSSPRCFHVRPRYSRRHALRTLHPARLATRSGGHSRRTALGGDARPGHLRRRRSVGFALGVRPLPHRAGAHRTRRRTRRGR